MKMENEAQIKVHKELELMPQIDKKRREDNHHHHAQIQKNDSHSKIRDALVNYNFPQEELQEEYMKRRKGPLRERLSSATKKRESTSPTSSSLIHKRMLNLNNLNLLLKKEERLMNHPHSRKSQQVVRTSVESKKRKINEWLFMNN